LTRLEGGINLAGAQQPSAAAPRSSISVRLPLLEVNRGLEILRDKVDDPVRVIIDPAV
jgi:hypothetical protein